MKNYYSLQQYIVIFVIVMTLLVIGKDAMMRLDNDINKNPSHNNTSKRQWNVWSSGQTVYDNSSIRYEDDFSNIGGLVVPGAALLADLPTSYYSVAYLPVYVRNMHPHHGMRNFIPMRNLLLGMDLCYLEKKENRTEAIELFRKDAALSRQLRLPPLRYIIINKDKKNVLLRSEYLSLLSHRVGNGLLHISERIYTGEYLDLYELHTF